MVYKTNGFKETEKIAYDLAKEVLAGLSKNESKVFALEGELGAGKTTFVKGFAKGLGIKNKISSPTFVLMKRYVFKKSGGAGNHLLYHLDAYRLRNEKDLIALGIEEIILNPLAVVLIEWSDRVKNILPDSYTKIHIDHLADNLRKIEIRKISK